MIDLSPMRMADLPEIFEHYRKRYPYDSSYYSDELVDPQVRVFIVIPVFVESLEGIMESLSCCQAEVEEAKVVLVLNNAEGSDLTAKHKAQAKEWRGAVLDNGLKISIIEALTLPQKHAGVGLARKIGMDAALAAFAAINRDGLIVCLDADCRVQENYLQELLRAERAEINALSIYFEHPLTDLEEKRREQIIHYEIWLRYYVQALRSIGYPHAFHTVGSSMAVRASIYARIGGMNRRKAGEDFYFLHKLIPQGGFYDLTTTTIYPSARDSERVPFGTGRAMLDMNAGRKDFSQVYDPQVFQSIKPLLSDTVAILQGSCGQTEKPLLDAIDQLGWKSDFTALNSRSANDKSLLRNFYYWFNGFRMLKLVHWLRDNYYPDNPVGREFYMLLNIREKASPVLINTLRDLDRNSSFDYF